MQRLFGALATVVLLFSGCATGGPRISAAWQRPGYATKGFKKIAVIAVSGRQDVRRVLEDHVVSDLKELGIQAVAGTDLFMKPTISDEKAPTAEQKAEIRKVLVQQGFDGAIAMRLVSRDIVEKLEAALATDPRHAGDFYWDYGPFYDPVSRETTIDATKVVVVECGLFEAEKPGAVAVREITVEDAGTISQIRDGSRMLVQSFKDAGVLTAK